MSSTAEIDWTGFKSYLLQRANEKTVGERVRYSKQFASVLQSGDASPLLGLSPDKRIHCMKGLASLARFTGHYEEWMQLRRRYDLTWSTGTETLQTFQRFFSDDTRTLDAMLDWVRKAMRGMPRNMAAVIKFNCITGLRPSEALESLRLLINSQANKYYNPQQQNLEHFRFPQIFIRRTKCTHTYPI